MTGNGSFMSLPVAVAAGRWWAEPGFHHSNILCFYFETFRHFLPFCLFFSLFLSRFQLFFAPECVFLPEVVCVCDTLQESFRRVV